MARDGVGFKKSEAGYFQSPWPVALILGSFFAMTVPLTYLASGDRGFLSRWSVGLYYLGVLGITHFVITLTLYLQGANLRHFWSSPINRLTYFGLPLTIFLFFGLYHYLEVAAALPLIDLIVRFAVRLADFHHFGRQSHGVSQLFRKRAGLPFPGWMRRAEHFHFATLTLLMFVTYISGGTFRADRPASLILIAIEAGLFVWVSAGFVAAWREGGRLASLVAPLSYFLLQTASAALAVSNTAFYAFALAMHYVEYHVLMMPRCFHARLDGSSLPDRVLARLRRHKVVFYLGLVALASPITHFVVVGMGSLLRARTASGPDTLDYPLLVAVFDGLFVFHYFIESKVWRFGDPFFRASLLPLYFRAPGPGRADRGMAVPPVPTANREPGPALANSGRLEGLAEA